MVNWLLVIGNSPFVNHRSLLVPHLLYPVSCFLYSVFLLLASLLLTSFPLHPAPPIYSSTHSSVFSAVKNKKSLQREAIFDFPALLSIRLPTQAYPPTADCPDQVQRVLSQTPHQQALRPPLRTFPIISFHRHLSKKLPAHQFYALSLPFRCRPFHCPAGYSPPPPPKILYPSSHYRCTRWLLSQDWFLLPEQQSPPNDDSHKHSLPPYHLLPGYKVFLNDCYPCTYCLLGPRKFPYYKSRCLSMSISRSI